jgi:hypothetical protein
VRKELKALRVSWSSPSVLYQFERLVSQPAFMPCLAVQRCAGRPSAAHTDAMMHRTLSVRLASMSMEAVIRVAP